MGLGELLVKNFQRYKIHKKRQWAIAIEQNNINNLNLARLDKSEVKAIESIWGALGLKINPIFFQVFKTVVGFNPLYLSDDLFFPFIIRCLNPAEYCFAFEHKGFYPFLLKEISQPANYIRKIRGVFYNESMEVISIEKAAQILMEKKAAIIKPSKRSCMGKNVQKLNILQTKYNDCIQLLRDFNSDFVIQEYVMQSSQTAIFNNNSLNTFRVSSLFLNGKVTICSIIFRCGQGNTAVDNLGAGGLVVGVEENGAFKEYAFDNKYKKHSATSDGITFKDKHIDDVAKIVQFVKKYHPKFFPMCGFIGWDIALDLNNEPILIEVNLDFPGIQMEQIAICRPIFGERTKEVIEFVMREKEETIF